MKALTRRHRLVGAVAVGAAAAVAVTGVSLALWNDRVPISDAALHSGTVELRINSEAAATVNVNIAAQLTTPRTVYTPITVTNNPENRGVNYRLDNTTASSGASDLVASLTMTIGVPASADGCTGGTPGTPVTLTGGLPGARFTAARPLATGSSELLCVGLSVPAVTNAAFRAGAATLILEFSSENQ